MTDTTTPTEDTSTSTPAPDTTTPTPDSKPLEDMTVAELRAFADDHGLKDLPANTPKARLIAAIRHAIQPPSEQLVDYPRPVVDALGRNQLDPARVTFVRYEYGHLAVGYRSNSGSIVGYRLPLTEAEVAELVQIVPEG